MQTVGNIRLSNSAESVHNPAARRSSTRRLLGTSVPRQYPLRSSLRRNKEKQAGNTLSAGSSSGNNIGDSAASAAAVNTAAANSSSTITVTLLPASSSHPPTVPFRNSIAECYNVLLRSSVATSSTGGGSNILTPSFPYNRLSSRAVSLEQHRLSGLTFAEHQLLYGADSTYSCWHDPVPMDTTDGAAPHYHTSVAAAKIMLRNAAEGTQRQQQLLKQQAENTTSLSMMSFKAPRL